MSKSTNTTTVSVPKLTQAVLPTKLADIKRLCLDAAAKGNEAQNMYQIAACAAIQHLGKHKDIRVLRNLVEGMPDGLRKDSMSKFFDLYAPVSFTDEGEMLYDAAKPVKLGEALEKSWWTAKVPQPYKPFNFVDELEKLITKSQRKLDKIDPEKGDDLTPRDINEAKALLAKLRRNDIEAVA